MLIEFGFSERRQKVYRRGIEKLDEATLKLVNDAIERAFAEAPDALELAEDFLKAVMKDINERLPEMEKEVNDKLRREREGGGQEEEPIPFECRMCGCAEYTTHYNGVKGPRSSITGYECNGCSVTFNDVAEFSNK